MASPVSAKASPKLRNLPTVRDVAQAAAVAVGTVSRAMNGHAAVNSAIRERVLAAARRLNYTRLRRKPAAGAQNPTRAGVRLGLICFGMEDTLVHLPVVSAAMHGIEDAVAAEGGSLMFANIPRGDRVPGFLAENQVAGVILKGPNVGLLPPESENRLLQFIYRLPHVWLLGQLNNAQGDHCNFDQSIAGRLAAEHLRQKGHAHVAFLNPKPGHAQFENVKRAFCLAAEGLGLRATVYEPPTPADLSWPLPAISSQETVDTLVRQWAAQRPAQRPSAIAVGADITAVQMYATFAKLGIQVGRDVGVISCNDERSLIMQLNPALTTINVRADAVGRNAVARLLWRINHRDAAPARILVEPVLTERESVPQRRPRSPGSTPPGAGARRSGSR